MRLTEFYSNARKSDVVYYALLEPTTCSEILKRLQKVGFLADEPEETDRRSRRVHITPEGQTLCRQIDQRLVQISSLLSGRLNITEKHRSTQLPQQLDDFHKKIYDQHRDATLDEIVSTYLAEPR